MTVGAGLLVGRLVLHVPVKGEQEEAGVFGLAELRLLETLGGRRDGRRALPLSVVSPIYTTGS